MGCEANTTRMLPGRCQRVVQQSRSQGPRGRVGSNALWRMLTNREWAREARDRGPFFSSHPPPPVRMLGSWNGWNVEDRLPGGTSQLPNFPTDLTFFNDHARLP